MTNTPPEPQHLESAPQTHGRSKVGALVLLVSVLGLATALFMAWPFLQLFIEGPSLSHTVPAPQTAGVQPKPTPPDSAEIQGLKEQIQKLEQKLASLAASPSATPQSASHGLPRALEKPRLLLTYLKFWLALNQKVGIQQALSEFEALLDAEGRALLGPLKAQGLQIDVSLDQLLDQLPALFIQPETCAQKPCTQSPPWWQHIQRYVGMFIKIQTASKAGPTKKPLPLPQEVQDMIATAKHDRDLDKVLSFLRTHPQVNADRARFWQQQTENFLMIQAQLQKIEQHLFDTSREAP